MLPRVAKPADTVTPEVTKPADTVMPEVRKVLTPLQNLLTRAEINAVAKPADAVAEACW
jgi:hypothetical protein